MKTKALNPKKENIRAMPHAPLGLCPLWRAIKGKAPQGFALWATGNSIKKGFFSSLKKLSGPNLERKKLQNTSLSKKELSIILGGLLGDGSLKLYPGYKNARYSFRHSTFQKNYFLYKAECLKNLSSPGSIQIQIQKPDGWSQNQKLRFSSRALSSLTEIHSITHQSNRLKIQRRWLNHLTEQSLAIWWFDDGSIVGGGRQGCLCTDGFTLEENQILVKYLKKVWNIEGRLHPVKNPVFALSEANPSKLKSRSAFSMEYGNNFQFSKKISLNPTGLKVFRISSKAKTSALIVARGNKDVFVAQALAHRVCPKGLPRIGAQTPSGHKLCYPKRLRARSKEPRFLKKSYRVYFSTLELKKFLTIIIPYVPHNDMLYKCTIKYKSKKLQERWISHMISLLPEKFHNQLRK